MQSEYVDEERPIFGGETLEQTRPYFDSPCEEYEIPPASSPRSATSTAFQKPENQILLNSLDPNHREIDPYHYLAEDRKSRHASEHTSATTGPMDESSLQAPAHVAGRPMTAGAAGPGVLTEPNTTSNIELAAAALKETDKANATSIASRRGPKISSPPKNTRVDSAQSSEEVLPPQAKLGAGAQTPLTLQTSPFASESQNASVKNDTITASPTLRKHVISPPCGNPNTLPAVQPTSPVQERETAGSPTTTLPSFRQFTGGLGQLNKLAEVAATQGPAPHLLHSHSRNNSLSYSAATAPSPQLPYHNFPASVQTSPANQYPYSASTARSPTSTISDMTHAAYGSPQQYPSPMAYFADRRRSSAATDLVPPYPISSLPSASSSGESHGFAGSSTEGYSTAHTTPTDLAQVVDGQTPRPIPILPPPPGMPQSAIIMNSGFQCDYPGCNSVPFQTQYLLSSHKNVHSSTRPYYCAVTECPRSEGGKGFKRKNEMIRHGLVHNSPGYVCPFCPDREHRYPRPDNLQRHVRVHHVDKDRDDPELRGVLAQRIEGIGKQRRRRTNAHGATDA